MPPVPSSWSIFQYSILALPLTFAGLPLYIHAPDFYTRDLGLNMGIIGMILLMIRLFDAVQDPFIGYVCDRYSNWRFTIISAGIIMLILGMVAVFYGPQFKLSVALWFTLSMILATTGFSIVAINLTMIGGLWHNDPAQRTRISGWRERFALLGLLIASILPVALQNYWPTETAFRILVWGFLPIILIGFAFFTYFMRTNLTHHALLGQAPSPENNHNQFLFLAAFKPQNRRFFGVCFLTHFAAAIPGVLVLFFVRDYLAAESLAGLFLFLYFIAGALFMALWVALANKIGKARAWLISMILSILAFIWAFFLQPNDHIAYGIICVASGIALGADLALPPAMLADRITQYKTQTQATQYYSLLALIPKLALALASFIAFMVLDVLGFVAGMQNSAEALQGLLFLYALLPCMIKLIAIYHLWILYKEGKNDA